MKRYIIIAIAVLVVVVGYAIFVPRSVKQPIEGLLGFSSENVGGLPRTATEFNQVGLTASRSQQGVIKTSGGRVFAVEVTSDTNNLRYFQLFDMIASTSSAAKPIGSYRKYASPSLVFSVPIPAATSSSSPTIVRISSDVFSPARSFTKGIIFGISSVFGSYSSASVNTDRHTVKVIYE